MHSSLGPEKTIHPGPERGCAAGSSTLFKWIINRWVELFRGGVHFQRSLFNSIIMYVVVFLSGLSIGDSLGNRTIGIVLTVVGVVVLDFCADASEGPIRAYLLDVADTEEQDMALNIHAFSAGKTHIW